MASKSSNIWQNEYDKIKQYNPNSRKWVTYIVQNSEICLIRRNFGHGFISIGWEDPDEKVIVYSHFPEDGRRSKIMWDRQLKLAKEMCTIYNRIHP